MLVLFEGPVGTVSGYGFHSRDLVRSLIKKYPDWDIKIVPRRWGATPQNYLEKGRDDDILDRILNSQLPRQPELYIQITIPNEFRKIGEYNIGITAGIETDRCHSDWIKGMNKMDLVITTSEQSKKVLEEAKYDILDKRTKDKKGELTVNTPIEVLFEGVDLDIFKPVNVKDDIIDNIEEDFIYLFVGHWIKGDHRHDRKDVGGLIEDFSNVFKDSKSKNIPALLLKISGANFGHIDRHQIFKKINSITNGEEKPPIYVLHGGLTDEELNKLYNSPKIKCLTSFSHGEGYGRPLAEFSAATGKPIITSGWGGQLDFLDKKYTTLLPGELKKVDKSVLQKNIIIEDAKWYYVDDDAAMRHIKNIHENYDEYNRKSKKQGKLIRNNYSLNDMEDKFKEIIDEYVPLVSEIKLPKLKKINDDEDGDDRLSIKLPKLKKIENPDNGKN